MSKAFGWIDDPDHPEFDADLAALEKQALDAVKGIAKHADTHPDAVLNISATLRKVSTVAGSHAQTLGLRIATVKGGRRV